MGRKKMTDEHKAKIQEARQKALEEKEANRIELKISTYTIESYDYGFKVFLTSNPAKTFFYPTLKGACLSVLSKKLSATGSRDVQSIVKAIEKAESEIVASLEKIAV